MSEQKLKELVEIIKDYHASHVYPDCGGDFDVDVCGDDCRHYWECSNDYELHEKLNKLLEED